MSVAKPGSLKAVIVGGGVAGCAAAARLAEGGFETWIIERKPFIGGYAAELGCKASDVCLKCSVCVAHNIFRSVLANRITHVLTDCQLVELVDEHNSLHSSSSSAYLAKLEQNPQYINHDLCTACGACIKACTAKCIYQPYPGIYGGRPLIEQSKCLRAKGAKCSKCASVCGFGAINLAAKPRRLDVPANAVVVAAGYQPFDPSIIGSYGYKSVPNVITGLEAERQLAATRKIARPSDGQTPKKIAFIQCVGSRSEQAHRRPEDTNYCSTVCCAYAMRTARKLKYTNPDSTVTIFYMDLQNFGKNFTAFYREGMKGVRFVRARPSEVASVASGNALVTYEDRDKGAVQREEFDLVVLSIGMRPAEDFSSLADRLGIPLDENGFFGLKGASGLAATQKKNIFVIGACEAPRDIAACIGQAEAACSEISLLNR